MRDVLALFTHIAITLFRFCRPGGVRAVMAESLLLRHQLLILNRGRQRAPNLRPADRVIAGACALFMRPSRILRTAIVLKPSTILGFHCTLVRWKCRLLFSPKCRGRPGPKGPTAELIAAIVAMKRRNPRWGCPRITQQIGLSFGIDIDKDVVRRVLARHYHPKAGGDGPSWLTFMGNIKDSLWSLDMFRCESLSLRSHWLLLVMDQYTRRMIGFGVHAGNLDGITVCRMFNAAIRNHALPRYISTDNDPLFEFHRWRANLRVIEVEEIKTVPYVPLSHPFVERLIGTLRREYLDQVPFWGATDLRRKLAEFQDFYNTHRVHASLDGETPARRAGHTATAPLSICHFGWQSHCRGLFQTPVPL
jgi:transposase InsO family protein